MKKTITCLLTTTLLIGGCSTVTIQPKQVPKDTSVPSYQKTEHFYLWGLVGEKHVDVKNICGSKSVRQMQTQQTFINGLAASVTLGIYAPHTVKVWCD
ncbi:Bor family protein [Arsukibacterium sp. MJ3]|uniref:Bor family protein n=1 Tax=Arsukibacterium sp. MJ3 TaxID=1632859 RepID=UPI0006270767|nr:Bor family protein [Arsukibacterium sp. MJ3]KKO50233.1 Bor family protein [Arsukibacterium sp. MJ3]